MIGLTVPWLCLFYSLVGQPSFIVHHMQTFFHLYALDSLYKQTRDFGLVITGFHVKTYHSGKKKNRQLTVSGENKDFII